MAARISSCSGPSLLLLHAKKILRRGGYLLNLAKTDLGGFDSIGVLAVLSFHWLIVLLI